MSYLPSLPPVVCRRSRVLFTSRYLCLFAYSGVQHILCCFCLVFLRIVYPMLPVSLDCPILIAPPVTVIGYFINMKRNALQMDH